MKSTSIDIALNILELFSAEKVELGISEIARQLEKKANMVHRTVSILKSRGYLEQATERGKYRLGLKAFELGCVYENQSDVIKEAMKELESLSKATTPASRCSDERIEEIKKIMQRIVQ